MLLELECIPCILNMSASMIRLLDLDESYAREIFAEILKIPSLRLDSSDTTSPDVIEQVMKKIMKASGYRDPFSAAKKKQNDINLVKFSLTRVDICIFPV